MSDESRPPLISETGPLRLREWLFWLIIALLVTILLVYWWNKQHNEHRYDEQILRVSQRHRVNPALVKAVVWRESKFSPRVRGRAGEIGLMQIRGTTAQEWAQSVKGERAFSGNLFDPDTNLEIGSWYLSKLLRRYARTDNPRAYALADYNAGRSNVLRWAKGSAETNSASFLAQITFPSTQEYVRSILRRLPKYERSFSTYAATRG